MEYIVIALLLGLIFVLTGFFVKKYPRSLLGYSQLERDGVAQDLIQKYINLLSKCMYIVGTIVVIGGVVTYLLDWSFGQTFILILPPLGMILFVVSKAPKISKVTVIASFTLVLALIGVLFFISREPLVTITDKGVEVSGIYGEFVPNSQIKHVELINKMPHLGIRTNGLGLGPVKKGYFRVDTLGVAKLFLHSDAGPFLKIEKLDSSYVFLNSTDSLLTKGYYYQLMKYFIQPSM